MTRTATLSYWVRRDTGTGTIREVIAECDCDWIGDAGEVPDARFLGIGHGHICPRCCRPFQERTLTGALVRYPGEVLIEDAWT